MEWEMLFKDQNTDVSFLATTSTIMCPFLFLLMVTNGIWNPHLEKNTSDECEFNGISWLANIAACCGLLGPLVTLGITPQINASMRSSQAQASSSNLAENQRSRACVCVSLLRRVGKSQGSERWTHNCSALLTPPRRLRLSSLWSSFPYRSFPSQASWASFGQHFG